MNKATVLTLGLLCIVFCGNSGASIMYLDIPDGSPVEGESYDFVNVYGPLPGESTVDLHGIGITSLNTYNSTVTNFDNVVFSQVTANQDSVLNFDNSGADNLLCLDRSLVNYSGNQIDSIDAYNQSTVNILSGGVMHLTLYDSSEVNFNDGKKGNIQVIDDSVINIYGGQIFTVASFYSGIVNIYGYGFDLDGYNLTGFWQGGEAFSMDIFSQVNDNLNLITIPEPATVLLLGLGGLVLGGRRKV